MIVHGDRDEFFPLSIPIEMYSTIPESCLWIVPNSGHTDLLEAISLHSQPTEFPRLAHEFLKLGMESTPL
jgi:pimeloyl-ACP methyl ester carboxylesterase